MGKSGLLDHFASKVSPDAIADHFWETRKMELSRTVAQRVARGVKRKLWEEEKEDIIPFVELIMFLTKRFDITNIEGYAMACYIYKAVGGLDNPTRREIGDITEKTIEYANKLRLENWDRFMRILK